MKNINYNFCSIVTLFIARASLPVKCQKLVFHSKWSKVCDQYVDQIIWLALREFKDDF